MHMIFISSLQQHAHFVFYQLQKINEMNFITKQLEKKLGVDLNGDGIIGSGYGRGGSLVGKLEEATHIDTNNSNIMKAYSVFQEKCLHNSRIILLNKDGRIGRGPAPFPNYSQSYNSYGGPPNFQSGNSGMINELEKATNIDLNHDGRIGGGPAPFPNYPQSYNSYGGPPNFQSGNSGQSSYFQAYGFFQLDCGVIQSKPFSVSLQINLTEYIPCAIVQMSPTLRSRYCRNLSGFLPTENSTSHIIIEGTNNTSILGPEVILNTWTHISVTYSMINGLRLYFDSTDSFPFEASGSIIYLQIGFSRWCTSYIIPNADYKGLIDEVYVHSRELTQAEINILVNS
ncbi:unnamed protein product [Rotaria magnacalcarata]|uniref:Uncharacterized protein n=1 Tax=Rotaria magnacalcarata TaxID=392030 RepID=A0A816T6Z5_9BILA|nr:unnamed protein product [Rotaria magnacalcarata]